MIGHILNFKRYRFPGFSNVIRKALDKPYLLGPPPIVKCTIPWVIASLPECILKSRNDLYKREDGYTNSIYREGTEGLRGTYPLMPRNYFANGRNLLQLHGERLKRGLIIPDKVDSKSTQNVSTYRLYKD